MLKWFRKQGSGLATKEIEAYNLGRQIFQRFATGLETIIEGGFGPVRTRYLEILRESVHKAFTHTDAPPFYVARLEYKLFMDNVAELHKFMTEQIAKEAEASLADADEMEVRDVWEAAIATRISEFTKDLEDRGLFLLAEYGDALKSADDAWRAANPQKSVEFPNVTWPPEATRNAY